MNLVLFGRRVTCAECANVFRERPSLDHTKRRPCPNCGATGRVVTVAATERVRSKDRAR